MIDPRHWRDRLLRRASILLAIAMFAGTMLVASTFAPAPGSPSPAPSISVAGYAGPDVIGVFTACNPACDLEVATEGIGRRLTFTDREVDESAPSLSPDGMRVAYRCAEPAIEPGGTESPRPAGLGAICVVAMLGFEPDATPPPVTTLIATPDVDYGAPAWSTDGSALAFDFRAADGEAGIAVSSIDGGPPTKLVSSTLTPDTGGASNPVWSADGSRLAFICRIGAGADAQESTTFCTTPTGGGAVTAFGSARGTCGTPAFMPDGVHVGVVCVEAPASGGDLVILNLDEPFTHIYTTGGLIAPEGVRRVVFSPDQQLAFVRRGDAVWAIGIPEPAWSLPPLPPLHGDFDLRVLE